MLLAAMLEAAAFGCAAIGRYLVPIYIYGNRDGKQMMKVVRRLPATFFAYRTTTYLCCWLAGLSMTSSSSSLIGWVFHTNFLP